MVVHKLATNLLLKSGDVPQIEASRPVSMAGANKVEVTVTLTRNTMNQTTDLSVHVQGANEPETKWTSLASFSAGTVAATLHTAVSVSQGWVRLLYAYTGATDGTEEAVLDASINTLLG